MQINHKQNSEDCSIVMENTSKENMNKLAWAKPHSRFPLGFPMKPSSIGAHLYLKTSQSLVQNLKPKIKIWVGSDK